MKVVPCASVNVRLRVSECVVCHRPHHSKKLTATAEVLKVVKGHKKGVDIPKLKKKTGFADTKIRAIIYRASKEGKIKRLSRGVYVLA